MQFTSNRINVYSSRAGTNFDKAVSLSKNDSHDTVVIFSDGSKESFEYISRMDISQFSPKVKNIGIMRTPVCEVRVKNERGETSNPVFFERKSHIDTWFCAKVAAPHFEIYVKSAGSESETHSLLPKKQTYGMCYYTKMLYDAISIVEDTIAFPSAVIDTFIPNIECLSNKNLTTEKLIEFTGLESISYHSMTDTISYEMNGDVFTVRRNLLKDIFEKNLSALIGFIDKIAIDVLDLQVKLVGVPEYSEDIVKMSPSELGRMVHSFLKSCVFTDITEDAPISDVDLGKFGKKAIVTDENCLWTSSRKNFDKFVFENAELIKLPSVEQN